MIFIFIFMYIENRERYIFFELKDLNIFFVEAKPSYSIYCCCSKNNNLYFFPVSDYFKSLILFISKIKVGFLKRFIHPQEPSMYICSSFKHLCIYYLHSSMFFFLFLQLYTWLEPPHRVGSTRTDQNMTTNS